MIRKVSSKQAVKNRKYKKICTRLDEEFDGRCFITGVPVMIPEHHHLFGRAGDLMTDERYIVCVAPDHKIWWHSVALSDLKLMPWWESFLLRLKEKGIEDKTYHKLFLKYSDV